MKPPASFWREKNRNQHPPATSMVSHVVVQIVNLLFQPPLPNTRPPQSLHHPLCEQRSIRHHEDHGENATSTRPGFLSVEKIDGDGRVERRGFFPNVSKQAENRWFCDFEAPKCMENAMLVTKCKYVFLRIISKRYLPVN